MKRITILFLAFMLIPFHAFAIDDSSIKTKWGYSGKNGPAFWGTLDPHFAICKTGKTQSPIDIPTNNTQIDSELVIDYRPAPLIIVNDGTTTLEIGKERTIINDGHAIQVNFNNGNETIKFKDEAFELVQFHLHIPSENKLNGHTFPLEIHFVHQGKQGHIAVLGVFAIVSKENSSLQKLIDHSPQEIGIAQTIEHEKINPADFLPKQHSYYHFMGSLTTPPCAEEVAWLVMQTPITLSNSQLTSLKKIMNKNARPIQPLNNREVVHGIIKKY